ncbi:hypothetical protein BDZ91DRAFT_522537 [Kalaharituber pfeilii]|nr:hypothetical protein BDZ91DRAFT_522537 [Kalaharituber pfeilii]
MQWVCAWGYGYRKIWVYRKLVALYTRTEFIPLQQASTYNAHCWLNLLDIFVRWIVTGLDSPIAISCIYRLFRVIHIARVKTSFVYNTEKRNTRVAKLQYTDTVGTRGMVGSYEYDAVVVG